MKTIADLANQIQGMMESAQYLGELQDDWCASYIVRAEVSKNIEMIEIATDMTNRLKNRTQKRVDAFEGTKILLNPSFRDMHDEIEKLLLSLVALVKNSKRKRK